MSGSPEAAEGGATPTHHTGTSQELRAEFPLKQPGWA